MKDKPCIKARRADPAEPKKSQTIHSVAVYGCELISMLLCIEVIYQEFLFHSSHYMENPNIHKIRVTVRIGTNLRG